MQQRKTEHGDPPAAMSAEQALARLGGVISRSSFYSAIRRGEVPHRRLGKRIIIPRHAFLRWLDGALEGAE